MLRLVFQSNVIRSTLLKNICNILSNEVNVCIQGSKPWRYTGKEDNMQREDIKMLVEKWKAIYEDESLDYKRTLMQDGRAVLTPLISAVIAAEANNAPSMQYVTAPSAA